VTFLAKAGEPNRIIDPALALVRPTAQAVPADVAATL
jgi:hypothetical protein